MRNTFLKFVTLLAFGFSTLISGNAIAHDNKQYTIGFAAANLQADFFNFIKESVEAETSRLGHKSIVVDSGGDDAKQVSQIEDLLVKQIDALVLIISGNTDGNAQIRKAKEAGIPVITVDRNTTNPPGDSFIASDSEVAAYEMGMWVAEKTGGKGIVGVIQGQLGSTPEIARDTGFENAIAQFPDLNTVEKQASKMWSRDEGRYIEMCFAELVNKYQEPDNRVKTNGRIKKYLIFGTNFQRSVTITRSVMIFRQLSDTKDKRKNMP